MRKKCFQRKAPNKQKSSNRNPKHNKIKIAHKQEKATERKSGSQKHKWYQKSNRPKNLQNNNPQKKMNN